MEHLKPFASVPEKKGLIILLIIMVLLGLSLAAEAQDNYSKLNKRYQRAANRKNEGRLVRACRITHRNRTHKPHKPIFARHRKPSPNTSSERSVIEVRKNDVIADASKTKPVVKPVAKPVTKTPPVKVKIEQISPQKLVTLHKKEDEVLATNKLPVPTSAKHEEVRKRVADKLDSKTNVYPLVLAPLYFQFNQDEFSVVDMEPFLMAAEYALQGRTLLIEGHTDNRGEDDFNVKLSIKRVQKIRQLMLDMGVPDERISVVGYGEELGKEKSKTKTDTEHQNNRRVDFTIF